MSNYTTKTSEQSIGRWWLSIIVGLVAIAAGIIVFINPVASYLAVALWLGVAVLLSGIFNLIQCFSTDNSFVRNAWVVIAAIVDIIIGVALMFNTLFAVVMLPLLFGIWLLCRGVVVLVQGLDLRSYRIRNAGWVILGAVVMIAISFVVLLLPESFGIEALILFIGIAFVAYGVSAVALGFKLYDISDRVKEVDD
ncbi:MAG: DUF308 domain-containing protein [Alistipes sp.]|nr:DUF308 domain-containing protein [Alistipes sp.]MBO7307424.1 DUF308 domain-containing protein [Alistipes sp.]